MAKEAIERGGKFVRQRSYKARVRRLGIERVLVNCRKGTGGRPGPESVRGR